MNVDRAEQKNLGRRTSGKGFHNRDPVSYVGDLILAQPDIFPEICLQAWVQRSGTGLGGRGDRGQHKKRCNSASEQANLVRAPAAASRIESPFEHCSHDTSDNLIHASPM